MDRCEYPPGTPFSTTRDTDRQAREQGCVALLGDASHPTFLHSSLGAAMSVEDGAVLGILLCRLAQSEVEDARRYIPEILQLYEKLQNPARRSTLEALLRVAEHTSCPTVWNKRRETQYFRKPITSPRLSCSSAISTTKKICSDTTLSLLQRGL